jgi:hypothetical protein
MAVDRREAAAVNLSNSTIVVATQDDALTSAALLDEGVGRTLVLDQEGTGRTFGRAFLHAQDGARSRCWPEISPTDTVGKTKNETKAQLPIRHEYAQYAKET